MEQRPDPEKLLQQVQAQEREEKRGKLKIYLGAAPGVGKTFTMLQDAHEKRTQGLDIVVGIVEAHGRQEITNLLKGLEILPRQTIEYRGTQATEFDLDAALKRSPAVILVDEFAHTNVPGLRHGKRWQDIRELLDCGIDVYTTLNVQHIESLNDIVSQIVQTRIKETVPDSMLDMADTIELVDLPPEDLIKRLQEGKVYIPAQAELAVENFFRKGNLIALRELALRITAERVEAQVLLYRQGQGIKKIWPTKEKILVCVGSGPESNKIIRAARRMATSLHADWIAVHVDTPRLHLSEEQRNNAIQNLRLAEQLGAETRLLTGTDVVNEIMEFAREQNATKIVVWKRINSKFKSIFFSSLADEIMRHSHEIDIYIITGEVDTYKRSKPILALKKNKLSFKIFSIAIGIVAIATGINLFLHLFLSASNLVMVYLLGVSIVALFGRIGPSILASVLSVLAYDYFFIPPYLSLAVADREYFMTLMVMLVVTLFISSLAIFSRRQADVARFAEHHTASLHSLSSQLASTRGSNKLTQIAVRYIGEYFNSGVIILLPENSHLEVVARYRAEQVLSTKEEGVARWVYDMGQIAGAGTDTLPFSEALYVPLLASQGTIGVLRVRPTESGHLFSPEQMHLLEDCANQIALALEVDRLQERAKRTELKTETDRARNALLQAVSHDLRTPLVAAMGAATTITEMGAELDVREIKRLSRDIHSELEQLNRLTNNLLQITYLESEKIKLEKEFYPLADTIHSVVNMLGKKLGKRVVEIKHSPTLTNVPYDNTLIQEVLINLMDNAIKFTPPDSPIEIMVLPGKEKVMVCVKDQGPGIMPDEVNKLFDKFYRGRMITTKRGLGLGLAICHSIIKAHGGDIWAENRMEGGAAFCFTLPMQL